ncbi:hypothetical protein [uncultured Tateyamaria sp.]|uniref:hypothetical protein n=1 Tax=uncultured Tateyamaria sp. TaxID=455651 RepID=UPI00260480F5|nr:hypothetical protein [uncultured Tateyamaria sp.]
MTRVTRRQAIGLIGASALSACAPAIPLSQVGDDPFEGGIGGTGIVGLMTGTGSVLVNGMRVELPGAVRVFMDGARVGTAALQPGMGLSMVARTRLDRFEAVRIDVDTPLIGTLARHGAGFAINGTPLRPDPGLSLASHVGHRVAAHGIWRADGAVQTSLVTAAPAGPDRLSGVLVGSAADGWQIGQTRVETDARLTAGQFAVAVGTYHGGRLAAQTVQMGRFREGGGTLRQLSVEGFLEPVQTAPGFRIAGLGHSFDQRLDLAPFAARRAVYFGPYDGLFRARRAVVLPQSAAQRATLLRPDDGARISGGIGAENTLPVIRK